MILKGSKEDKGIQFRGRAIPQIQVGVLGVAYACPVICRPESKRDLQTGTRSDARARARQKFPQGELSRENDKLVEGRGPRLACQGSTCRFREGRVETGMVELCHTPGLTVCERPCFLRADAGVAGP